MVRVKAVCIWLLLVTAVFADPPAAQTPEECVKNFYTALAQVKDSRQALTSLFAPSQHYQESYRDDLRSTLDSTFVDYRAPIYQCSSDLKNIATAVEMYSTDNGGRYPAQLKAVAPLYLKTLPVCPSAGADTYSKSYTVATVPDAYTFFCSGHHHTRSNQPANYPQFTAFEGLRREHGPNLFPKVIKYEIEKPDVQQLYGHPEQAQIRVKETFQTDPETPNRTANVTFICYHLSDGWYLKGMDPEVLQLHAQYELAKEFKLFALGASVSRAPDVEQAIQSMGVALRLWVFATASLDHNQKVIDVVAHDIHLFRPDADVLVHVAESAAAFYWQNKRWPSAAELGLPASQARIVLVPAADGQKLEVYQPCPARPHLGVAADYPRAEVDRVGNCYVRLKP